MNPDTGPTMAVPVCYRHPDRETWLSCSRCGRPVCTQCVVEAPVGQRCPDCIAREGRQQNIKTNRRAVSGLSEAPFTKILIAVAVLAFAAGVLVPGLDRWLFVRLAQANELVQTGEWWRMFTVFVLHGGITHLLFNMWALYVLGPQIERASGSFGYLTMFFGAVGAGGATAVLLGNPGDVLVGASGGIFGIFGVWLIWSFHRRNTAYGRAMFAQFVGLLVINAALPLMIPNISWQGHLGGLVAGLVVGQLWETLKGADAARRRAIPGVLIAILSVLAVTIL